MSKKPASPELPVRTIKIDICPTLSGRSELTYHVGSNYESELFMKVTGNSGGGQFNADWVPLSVIEQLLTEYPADKPMSSRVLQPVFAGRSSNSAPFMVATLLSEGLVVAGQEKDSGYKLGNINQFKQAMSALIASDTNLETAVAASRTNLDTATDASSNSTKRKRKEN